MKVVAFADAYGRRLFLCPACARHVSAPPQHLNAELFLCASPALLCFPFPELILSLQFHCHLCYADFPLPLPVGTVPRTAMAFHIVSKSFLGPSCLFFAIARRFKSPPIKAVPKRLISMPSHCDALLRKAFAYHIYAVAAQLKSLSVHSLLYVFFAHLICSWHSLHI